MKIAILLLPKNWLYSILPPSSIVHHITINSTLFLFLREHICHTEICCQFDFFFGTTSLIFFLHDYPLNRLYWYPTDALLGKRGLF
jgi:hypothetical protein